MKRFPLVFLSLVILVTCTWLASSSPRVGKAAPDRTIPWWFGLSFDDLYHEFACIDGINYWVGSQLETKESDYWFSISAKPINEDLNILNQTLPLQYTDSDGWVSRYGEYTLYWNRPLTR